ncbi:MAG: hypothetical protein FD129_1742, partial [bacterium]
EILPSSMSADTTWNCVLSVTTNPIESETLRDLEDAALGAVLGSGSGDGLTARFDRYDARYNNNTGLSRRPGTEVGATATQLNAYQVINWRAGSSQSSNDQDVPMLDAWLRTNNGTRRGFWGNGPSFAPTMHYAGTVARNFLNQTLGTRYTCASARSANCPTGTALDSTFCLPLVAAATPAFGSPGPASLFGNGCRTLLNYPAITPEPTIPEALGNLSYWKNGSLAPYASITVDQPSGLAYRSVVDAFSLYHLRRSPTDSHDPGMCNDMTPMYERAFDVLGWLGTAECPTVMISGLPPIGSGPSPPVRPFLGEARPNPASGATRIAFAVARNGTPTRIDLFDVTGRLVRRLVDRPMDAGRHEVAWDGRAANGARVGAGLYFYRMVSGSFMETRKLVVAD